MNGGGGRGYVFHIDLKRAKLVFAKMFCDKIWNERCVLSKVLDMEWSKNFVIFRRQGHRLKSIRGRDFRSTSDAHQIVKAVFIGHSLFHNIGSIAMDCDYMLPKF